MTPEEMKRALLCEQPVIFEGILYDRITAIIYRKARKRGIQIQLELLDKNNNCIVLARPDRVTIADK